MFNHQYERKIYSYFLRIPLVLPWPLYGLLLGIVTIWPDFFKEYNHYLITKYILSVITTVALSPLALHIYYLFIAALTYKIEENVTIEFLRGWIVLIPVSTILLANIATGGTEI